VEGDRAARIDIERNALLPHGHEAGAAVRHLEAGTEQPPGRLTRTRLRPEPGRELVIVRVADRFQSADVEEPFAMVLVGRECRMLAEDCGWTVEIESCVKAHAPCHIADDAPVRS